MKLHSKLLFCKRTLPPSAIPLIKPLFLLSAIIILTLPSCFKPHGVNAAEELKVLNYADMKAANTAADQSWIWDTFRNRNPDVKIDREDLFNEPFHQKTEDYAASGKLPDVLYVWPSERSTSLHRRRLLKDLTPLLEKDGLKRVYSAAAMDPSQQASKYIAMIPLTVTSSHIFLINMEVLNACGLQPAKTYAELKAQVPVLAAKGYETVIMPNKDTWVMQTCLFSMIAGRFGGEGWHDRILNGNAKFTDPDFVNALDFIRQLYADKVLARSSLGMDYLDGPSAFAANKGAYYIDSDWRINAFITDKSSGQALISQERQSNFQINVFPEIAGAKINRTSSTIPGAGWAMSAAIPAGSAREDAAWRLIKWLTGREVQTLGINHGAYSFAARTDLNPAELTLEPLQKTAMTLPNYFDVATVVIDTVFGRDVFDVINDGLQEICLGSKTPQQVAADTQKAFDTWKAVNY